MILSTYHNDNQKERTDETRERKEENTIGTKQKEKDVIETKRYYTIISNFNSTPFLLAVFFTPNKPAGQERTNDWTHYTH